MCLIIQHVPRSKRAGLVVPCTKTLTRTWRHGHDNGFTTVFTRFDVPLTGLLVPSRRSRRRYFPYGHMLHGGFIHGYQDLSLRGQTHFRDEDLLAFALDVVAYGFDDLACRAMYIPDADFTGAQRENTAFFESEPTKRQILERFPRLKAHLK